MNFISLDFETANHSRVSICAAGLAVFEDGELAESPYWLVRPPKGHGWFRDDFIECHGLARLTGIAKSSAIHVGGAHRTRFQPPPSPSRRRSRRTRAAGNDATRKGNYPARTVAEDRLGTETVL